MDMALSSISRRTRVNISLVFHCFRVFTFSGTHLTPIRNIRVVCFPVSLPNTPSTRCVLSAPPPHI